MEDIVQDIHKKLGNLYEYLQITNNASKKDIKIAYKSMALIYHPDKNKAENSAEKFQFIKKVYDLLSDDKKKNEYDAYLKLLEDQKNRYEIMDKQRNKMANDLLEREKESKLRKEQDLKDIMERQLKKRQKEEREKKEADERALEEKKRQEAQYRDDAEFYKQINSVKVKWNQQDGIQYSESILKMIFNNFGPVKTCVLMENESKCVIEFFNTNCAEQCIKECETKDRIDDGIKVKFLIKSKRREQMITEHGLKKKNLKKKIDTNVSTQTLDKLANILNRDSKVYLQSAKTQISRESERERMIRDIIENKMNE